MGEEYLRNLLNNEKNNPLKIFADYELIRECRITFNTFFNLVNNYLDDEEILVLFEYSYIKGWPSYCKARLLNLISDEKILLQGLKNESIINSIESWDIYNILKKMSDEGKAEALSFESIANKLSNYEKADIINNMGNKEKYAILSNKQLVYGRLNLSEYSVVDLIENSSFEDKDKKILVDIYQFSGYNVVRIVKKYSDSNKEKELLENPIYQKHNKIEILCSFNVGNLIAFINKHKNVFFTGIKVYEIIMELDVEQQLEFVSNIERVNLTENEKKEILVTLKKEVKDRIDISKLTPTLKKAIDIETREYLGTIILDLDRDLEDYRGLDSLLKVNPTRFTEKERIKFLKLCNICPNLRVMSTLDSKDDDKEDRIECSSTAIDYIRSEEWIQNVLNSLKPKYKVAQKIAKIDNAIGKKISYSPDFNTEVFNSNDSRAIYAIINSGCGVCNGIARVEEYMFNRAGIDCEIVSSENHTFLKLKGIEFTLYNGESVVGTTILDPTWNLTEHRFNGRPRLCFISYDEARKMDIGIDGIDYECHKNDEELKDATFNLDQKSLINLFKSVGLADRDGNFPIKELLDKSEQLHKEYTNEPLKDIEEQFLLLADYYPEFATCQNSTIRILANNLFNNELFEYNRCVINRVYKKSDTNKRPVIFVYLESDKIGERFYYADANKKQFVELSYNEFLEQFECYENDIQNNNGKKLWETSEQNKKEIELSTTTNSDTQSEEEVK